MSRKQAKERARRPAKRRKPLLMSHVHLVGLQFKSLAIAEQVADALDIVDVHAGIHSVEFTLSDCFVCPDINLDMLDGTPFRVMLRGLLQKQLAHNLKEGRQI